MRLALRSLAVLAATVAVLLALDTVVWLVHPVTGQRYGSFPVRKVYEVKQKNGSMSFLFDDPLPVTCVNAIFPHPSASPCWYVSSHPEKHIEMCDTCSPIQLR